jgi:hypothetical protein
VIGFLFYSKRRNDMKNKRYQRFGIFAAAMAITLLTCPLLGLGITIAITFDMTPDGVVSSPFAGSGSFSYDTDPGNGAWPLSALGNYNFTFSFPATSSTFITADLTTTLDTIRIILSQKGGATDVTFSNVNPYGDGTLSGSMDFLNSSGDMLSFEAPGFEGAMTSYVMVTAADTFYGDYRSVTEPSTFLLFGTALGGLALLRRNRARKSRR